MISMLFMFVLQEADIKSAKFTNHKREWQEVWSPTLQVRQDQRQLIESLSSAASHWPWPAQRVLPSLPCTPPDLSFENRRGFEELAS